MAELAHITCAFADGAISIADRLADMARGYGLVAWMRARADGEWEIRLEGESALLEKFTAEVGLDQVIGRAAAPRL